MEAYNDGKSHQAYKGGHYSGEGDDLQHGHVQAVSLRPPGSLLAPASGPRSELGLCRLRTLCINTQAPQASTIVKMSTSMSSMAVAAKMKTSPAS